MDQELERERTEVLLIADLTLDEQTRQEETASHWMSEPKE